MNLTQLNERLDQIQSEMLRREARHKQIMAELHEIRNRVVAFIGAPTPARIQAGESITPLAELEKAAILHAVAACGNAERAAIALGVGKTTIYRKLDRYRAMGNGQHAGGGS